ncbi:CPBP family intramembrane glutamic endopeptidase [Plantactinospora solaniradicis]|uniref:CPBP family intramembrane glutamic endopeptidase n=1 Tax=Plantactinospora solaniradicis TaxID=1723736 RepID=A0ABW1KQ18_9ACTN
MSRPSTFRRWWREPWRTSTARRDIVIGLGIGIGTPCLVLLALWTAGLQRVYWHGTTAADLVTTIATGALIGSVLEELVFRYLALRGLQLLIGSVAASAVTALAFGSLHLVSPYATLLGGIAATAAGLMFNAAYLATRTMWLPLALHIGWNLVTVVAVGVPVGGAHRLFHLTPHGADLLSGGRYGPDGSIVTVAACLILTASLIARRTPRSILKKR